MVARPSATACFALLAVLALLTSGCPERPLDDERIDAVLRASRAQIAGDCLKDRVPDEVSVRVRFDVAAGGDIRYARATAAASFADGGGDERVDALVTCIQSAVAHLRFPASENGRTGVERTLRVDMRPDATVPLTW